MTDAQEVRFGRVVAARIFGLQRPDESDAAFARRLGVDPQVLNNWKDKPGKQPDGVSIDKLHAIVRHGGVNPYYLLLGEGDSYSPPSVDASQTAVRQIEDILRQMRAAAPTRAARTASQLGARKRGPRGRHPPQSGSQP